MTDETVSAATVVYELVREGILTGVYRPGTRLREQELASVTGISRTPVREALQRLHVEGIIRILPRRGAIVTEWTAVELDELFEIRALLEGYAAGQAAKKITEKDIDTLFDYVDQIDAARAEHSVKSLDRLAELMLDFRRHVHGIAANHQLAVAIANANQAAIVFHTVHLYSSEELALTCSQHRELAMALRARDPGWASATMRGIAHADRNSLRRHKTERIAAEGGESHFDDSNIPTPPQKDVVWY